MLGISNMLPFITSLFYKYTKKALFNHTIGISNSVQHHDNKYY
jgi:hypothetical protein